MSDTVTDAVPRSAEPLLMKVLALAFTVFIVGYILVPILVTVVMSFNDAAMIRFPINVWSTKWYVDFFGSAVLGEGPGDQAGPRRAFSDALASFWPPSALAARPVHRHDRVIEPILVLCKPDGTRALGDDVGVELEPAVGDPEHQGKVDGSQAVGRAPDAVAAFQQEQEQLLVGHYSG